MHPFGPIGRREIKSRQGLQVSLSSTWTRETPLQRSLRLVRLGERLSGLPQFQGDGNQLTFGVVVPGGALYAMPHNQYENLIGQGGIRAWTQYEMAMLPIVLTIMDRHIRGERFIVGPIKVIP